MEITSKELRPGVLEVTAELDQKTWKDAQEKAFHKLSKDVSVPGFRPGKAPEKLLRERVNSASIYDEAASSVLNPTLVEIINQTKCEVFRRPDVRIEKFSDSELTLVYTIVVAPTCELGQYKDLGVKKEEAKVEDKDVDEAVKRAFEGLADLVNVEREAKEGDTLSIDFKGFIKNEKGEEVAFEGGEAQNYDLTLGSHSFIPGFEESLVGSKTGEEKDIEVTFPEAYVKELAGKPARFHVVIHEVKEKQLREMNDESVKDLSIEGVETLEALREHEKAELLKSKEQEVENRRLDEIVNKIREGSKFVIADEIAIDEGRARLEQLKERVKSSGLEFSQYLELTKNNEEKLLEECKVEGLRNIQNMLALNEVAKKENITVGEKELEEHYKKLSEQYSMPLENVKNALKEREGDILSQIRGEAIVAALLKLN